MAYKSEEILGSPTPSAAEGVSADTASAAPTEEGAATPVVVSSTVPSGYTISYCPDPRGYTIDGIEVPSVTTVLDCLSKPALTWWGMKIGVAGVTQLLADEVLPGSYPDSLLTTEDIVKLLTEHKLTVNHQRDKAAKRGTNVHNALEHWALTGKLAHPDDFPEEEQGYVRGLNAFLADCKGQLVALDSELMVGSKEHGFAGRFDLRAQTISEIQFQTGPRTRRSVQRGVGIFDLKTSKGVYDSHYLQLSAYRLGLEESGYGRSDFEAIILVNADGRYDVKLNPKRPDHFLSVLNTWRALR